MPIVAGTLLLLLTVWLVVGFFRVRCPKGFVLIVLRRAELPSQPPEVQFITEGAVFRTPSVAAIDLLSLQEQQVEAFSERTDSNGNLIVLHAQATVRVGTTTDRMRKAAGKIAGISITELGNIVEGALQSELSYAVYKQPVQFAACINNIEVDVKSRFGEILAAMGMTITELSVSLSNRQPYRCAYRRLKADPNLEPSVEN